MSANLPSKTTIIQYWREHERELADILGHLPDWDEPACWVCSYPVETWDRVMLERCHIIPKSLGGANVPSNLVLMCRRCHDTAPNTSFIDDFAQWASVQSDFKRRERDMLNAFEDMGLPIDDASLTRYTAVIRQPACIEFMREHSGSHWFRELRTGAGITPATLAALLRHYLASSPDTTSSLDCTD